MSNNAPTTDGVTPCTLEQLKELVAIQAEDVCLWHIDGVSIFEAYAQQALRYLTRAIEGEWSFDEAKAAIKEMQG